MAAGAVGAAVRVSQAMEVVRMAQTASGESVTEENQDEKAASVRWRKLQTAC